MSTAGAKILAHLARNKNVSDAIITRQSVRKYLDIPVPKPVIQDIIHTASRAPSGGNWKVYVLAGEKRQELVETVKSKFQSGELTETMKEEPYRSRRSKRDMHNLLGIEKLDCTARLEHFKNNWNFFEAPVGLIFSIDRQMHQDQFVDLGMYMQNVMLLSREKGLHTCTQEAWAMWSDTVQSILNMPSNELVFAGMSLGYADHSDPVNCLKTERADLSDFAVFHYDDSDADSVDAKNSITANL